MKDQYMTEYSQNPSRDKDTCAAEGKKEFLTELHCHTSEVSRCGKATAAEVVDFYLFRGYTTVVLTNHLNKSTFNNPKYGDQSGWDWQRRVDFFVGGYEKMKEAAAGRLNILLGCEFRSFTGPSDYQIYGITKEFLLEHPDIQQLEIKEVSKLVRTEGMLFIQAHPFRDGMYITKPSRLDGIEVFNGNLTKDNRNDIAEIWADRYGLIKVSGTDYHGKNPQAMPVGIATDFPIESNEQLLSTLRSGNYRLLRNRLAADGVTEERY